MKPEEVGIHIMTSVFNGLIGVGILIHGFVLTFVHTWEGWGCILFGIWMIFTASKIWELTDYLEKND